MALVFMALAMLAIAPVAPSHALEKAAAVEYAISVDIDPDSGQLTGHARIELPKRQKGGKWLVHAQGLEVISAELDGRALKVKKGHIKSKPGSLIINYRLSAKLGSQGTDPQNPGIVYGNLISPEGVALTGGWYPYVEGVDLAFYSLQATLPPGYEAVSEAEEITARTSGDKVEFAFLFPYPVESITLAAGPYRVFRADINNVEVYGYFLPEDASLAEDYVREAARYIEMYSALIGKFPYSRFSVVENLLPTGYSLPTYTLIGRSVLRLPFIIKTSLGHEVLHQWFGAGVYTDRKGGNWSEGLTAYLADHYFDELKGEGEAHRKKLLLDYRNYVHRNNDLPLHDFISRRDRATRSIGYGKSALVFHMLRREIGDEAFFKALNAFASKNRFRQASWDDIKSAAEVASGHDLDWFFKQWVTRTGQIKLRITRPVSLYLGGEHKVRFVLEQDGIPYRFKLPVTVKAGRGAASAELVEVSGKKTVIEIITPAEPETLVLDPNYDLFRELSDAEVPPTWSSLMGAKKKIFILPEGSKKSTMYTSLIDVLGQMGFNTISQDEAGLGSFADSAVVITTGASKLIKMVYGVEARELIHDTNYGFSLTTLPNPLNPKISMAIINATDKAEVDRVARKLMHYGKYSALGFNAGRNALKNISDSQSGLRVEFNSTPSFVRTSNTLSLDSVISEIESSDVIYVGESHDSFADHKLQLSVIKSLNERGHKVAVGMEMFEPEGQVGLDDFVSGELDEKAFLLNSGYYDSWGMNYHLYRGILDFAREKGLPVLGLNHDDSAVKKVSRRGFGALSEEETAKLPPAMDLTDLKYRDRLKAIFFGHGTRPSRNFDSFFHAQVLRDEAMAHNIARFMEENPGHKVVVIVGQGHVSYGSGIPKRLARINGSTYKILINSDSGIMDPDIADFVFFAPHAIPPTTPLLGVSLKKAEGGLSVLKVRKNSLADRAGIKKGDLLVSVGGKNITNVPGLKVALFDSSPGDELEVKVLRKSFFSGFKGHVFKITVP
jgi:uncharacterized iron-regulated protein